MPVPQEFYQQKPVVIASFALVIKTCTHPHANLTYSG